MRAAQEKKIYFFWIICEWNKKVSYLIDKHSLNWKRSRSFQFNLEKKRGNKSEQICYVLKQWAISFCWQSQNICYI